ncbi:hypothetical protein JZ751_026728 [Albula glossodonta]|uniref:Uncharacterized protein n=1 Tax=Albula glossodonta TaxID=121402 RepID=A0A8T2PAH0_9TELE|nr:hypothetical protein JZ751_026728 [Albula glossodonta]
MPPKDPLLGTLKVCILSLQSDGGTITDSSPHLSSCCQLLEVIFRKGLQQPVLGLVRRDYWHCMEQILQQDTCNRVSLLSLAVEQTSSCRKLLTSQGRGRYFLRLTLSRRILGNVVQHMLHTPKVLEWYSPDISIFRNEEFVEPFISLLLVLSEMEFKLNIENSSFLDESWLLPVCEVYEAVPCRELGMVLRYLGGRVFVLELIEGSQAQVDRCLQPGDIIDEINGISLRNASNGQAGVVLARLKGRPLSLRFLRWRGEDGAVYPPLVKLLHALQQENPSLQLKPSRIPQQQGCERQQQEQSQCLKEGRIVYIVQFLGKANIGMYGGKEVLQQGIPLVLEKKHPSKELFQHHYPEISCVGRYSQPDYTVFAFCVADCPETPESTGFCCVVLQAGSARECEDIVNRIATGFKHTEWFV